MNITALCRLLDDCLSNHYAESDSTLVDVHFLKVNIDLAKARANREALECLLADYPEDFTPLAQGPSYIDVGAALGDQRTALVLFAVGQVMGLWTVITPAKLGLSGKAADSAAGSGYVMCSGYRHDTSQSTIKKSGKK